MKTNQTEGKKGNILIVDDLPDNLLILRKPLTKHGYTVRQAMSGQEALRMILSEPPDLILLDIMMPQMNGYTLCQRLKANPETQEIPVIFVSALNGALDKVKAFEAGGGDYLTKPFEFAEVLVRIEHQLTLQRLQKQLASQNQRLQEEIHHRNIAQEAMQTSETEMLTLFAAMTELIVVVNAQGRYLKIVSTNQDLLYKPPEELIDKTLHEIYSPAKAEELLGYVHQALETNETVAVEYSLIFKDGRKRWYGANISPISRDSVIWVIRDITRRKQAEAALKRSEKKFSCAFHASPDAITLSTLRDGRLIEVNNSFLEIFGYSSEEVIGQTDLDLNIWVNLEFRQYFLKTLRSTGELLHQECELRTHSGEIKTVLLSVEIIDPDDQKYILSVIHDITERKQADEKIQLLLTITQAIHNAPDFNAALEVAIRKVCQATGWNYGEAWIKSADGMALECSPAWNFSHTNLDPTVVEAIEEFRQFSEGLMFLPGEELPGRVWQKGKPEWIVDMSQEADDLFLRSELAYNSGLKAGFGVPILAGQDKALVGGTESSQSSILAVLVFFTAEFCQKDQRLVELVSAVAAQLGSVMQQKLVGAEMRALFSAMTDVIFAVDSQGCFIKTAPTNAKIAGQPTEAVIGQTLHDIFAKDQADDFLRYIWEALNRQETVKFERSSLMDEQLMWLSISISPLSEDMVLWVARDITEQKQAEEALRAEKQKSERLLLNILPQTIADQLKQEQSSIASDVDEATILFADLVGFTPLASRMPAKQLVKLLNEIVSSFDQLTEDHGLEKIKTIGDAYMVAGGLPTPRADHAEAIADMALDMQTKITDFQRDTGEPFQLRIGINSGPVVAGVIGTRKFIYDLWGDTVNVASRMESQGKVGKIQVTGTTYALLRDKYNLEKHGPIVVKGKGEMDTYWLLGKANYSF